jgi:hypothetical protein
MDTSDFVIELPQIEFNPNDFLSFIDNYEFKNYISSLGNKTPQDVCYDEKLLEEDIIRHYLNIFKDFNISFDYIDASKGTGFAGWQLVAGDFSNQGLARHIDTYRPTCITFPLTFPQSIDFHETDETEDILFTYQYPSSIVILNSGTKSHSVSPTTDTRLQFQFDCYNSWEEVKELVKLFKKR